MSIVALEYIVNASAGVFFVSGLVSMLRPRWNIWLTLALQLGFMLLSINTEFVFLLRYWGYLRTPLLFLIVFGPCYFMYTDSKKRITLAVLLVHVVAFVVNILIEWYSLGINISDKNSFNPDRLYVMTIITLSMACTMIIAQIIWNKIDKKIWQQIIPLAIAISLGLLMLTHIIFTQNRELYYKNLTAFTLVLIFLAYALYIYSFLTVNNAVNANRHLQERNAMAERQEQISKYYQQAKESMDKVQMIRHDLANQLQVAEAMARREGADEESKRLISQLHEKLELYGHKIFCSNIVIDTTLSLLMPLCNENGIKLEATINVPEKLAISEIDLCSLFYNLAQNAFEASSLLPAEQRTVSMNAQVIQEYLVIKVTNRYALDAKRAKNDNRGYGLRIIKGLCEQYGGTSSVKSENGVFEVVVTLKCDW